MYPPASTYESLFFASFSINICFFILIAFVLIKKFRNRQNRQNVARPRQLNPIIRNTNPVVYPSNNRYFTLTESDDDSETRPLLSQPAHSQRSEAQSFHSNPVPISRPASVGEPAGSTTGWSWADITLTPPISVVRTSDPDQLRSEIARANSNFLHMKTFKPSDVRNNIPTYNETTV
jgi:hypothetical protein